MRLSTAITLALIALLLTSTVGVAATPAAPSVESDAATAVTDESSFEPVRTPDAHSSVSSIGTASSIASTDSPADDDPRQVFRIAIDENGDAQWMIESRIILTDDEEVDEFYEYADALAAGERSVSYDRQEFGYLAQIASERTGRDMAIRNAGWDEPRVEPLEDVENVNATETDHEDEGSVSVGIITYSFTWTNFATAENDHVYVGDVFQSDPIWFTLTDTQRLVIERPPNYALETPTQLSWNGPYEFSDDELEIAFVRSGGGGGADGTSSWLLPGLVVLIFVVGIGSYLFARRQPHIDLPEPLERLPERVAALGTRLGVPAHVFGRHNDRASNERDRRRNATGIDGSTTAQHVADESAPNGHADAANGTELEFEEGVDDDIDPELLSDEERVLRMLRQNGGRMKQASIVTETGWSNAKVSQLLSQMDEDDEIEKLRIGRENLITLPEVDPTKLN